MLNKISVFLVRCVSGFFKALGFRACRFHPSCSDYSVEAFRTRGWAKAVVVSFGRLLRCHPFSPGGFDPLK